jgi:hypothetical protein
MHIKYKNETTLVSVFDFREIKKILDQTTKARFRVENVTITIQNKTAFEAIKHKL